MMKTDMKKENATLKDSGWVEQALTSRTFTNNYRNINCQMFI